MAVRHLQQMISAQYREGESMTEVQNFMLVVCFGCTMGFLIGTFGIMVSDGIHYLKKRRRKKKEQKEQEKAE